MQLLVIYNGDYGLRHLENIQKHKPASWEIHTWQADVVYPLVIDYPEDYLPEGLPSVDLIVSFAEHRGVAELLPDLAEITQARAVLAPVDNESWLPRGLARQLHQWLARIDVFCATPKPLCSLTENSYLQSTRTKVAYDDPHISKFAVHFGMPRFQIRVDEQGVIEEVNVERDAVCGCTRFIAEGLIGLEASAAIEKAGLLHHHYPCRASMGIDPDFNDTLMHVSGNLAKDAVRDALGEDGKPQYLRPHNRVE